ncbi:CPBP family intramembrane glutamic endopeptidase [Yonghaparkia sp. Soil809]|uniref:CPBP family intramembrane glutamic endopeptidase n=1 Tax=Yonghaparkia sp. Soil809 TaxID=1736417 RepID=UPI0006F310FC|nr:type II CAAX endopeptidase family protein [Yonghaparkia sp. Soil809]KRF30894.1 abortive phage infection protein [Yonghaparkia sp. Soil809]
MSTDTRTNWLFLPDPATARSPQPTGVAYHRAYAGERRRILRGVLAIVLLVASLILFGQLFLDLADVVDERWLNGTGGAALAHGAGVLSVALLIPVSMLLQRVLYGVRPSSLHSVTGRFRFALLGRSLLVFGPFVLVSVSVVPLFLPSPQVAWSSVDLIAYFVISMLLVPLAAAGEECGFRGFMLRVLGGWTRGERSGAALGIIGTTVVFSLLHGSLDPYILTSYLILFGSLAIITWRTGGLELAIVLHAVYNTAQLALATTLHVDVAGQLASRDVAVGSPAQFIPGAVIVLITAVIWWATRATGPVRGS